MRVLLAFLLLAAPAQAQTWSPPRAMKGSQDASAPHLAISRDGTALRAWTRFTAGRPSIVVSGGLTVADDSDWLTGPVTYARSRFALAFTDARQTRLTATIGRENRRVATGRRIVSPQIAGNSRGDLAIAWFDDRGTRNDVVYVATRRPGGRFGKPRRLARGRIRSVSVAVGQSGRVLVAWDAFGKVRTHLLGTGAETIRSEEAYNARLRTRVLDNGRAVVGWTAKFRSEGGDARDTITQVAVRPAGASRFRTAQLLASSPDAPDAQGTLKLDESGTRAAWTQPDGIRLARADARASFGQTQAVAPAGALLQDITRDLMVWRHDDRLYAGGAPVSESNGATNADAAFDPSTGRPTVVWEQEGRILTTTRSG